MQRVAGSSSDNSNQPSQNSLQSMERFRFYLVLDLDCIVPRTEKEFKTLLAESFNTQM